MRFAPVLEALRGGATSLHHGSPHRRPLASQRLASHCIGCMNCVLACPFGVPRYLPELDLMMKCDMCYDRTSAGKRPMCVTVCPSGALAYGPRAEIEVLRRERPMNTFVFGPQVVQTKVHMMLPAGVEALEIDVTAFMTSETEMGRHGDTAMETDQPLPASPRRRVPASPPNRRELPCPKSRPGRTISPSRGWMTTL